MIRHLTRHWRGDLPLAVAFWVDGVLLGVLVQLARWWVRDPVDGWLVTAGPAAVRNALVGITAAGILLLTWQLVGIWRAASTQLARGRVSGWERSAQLTVLVCVFLAINAYVDAVFALAPLFARD